MISSPHIYSGHKIYRAEVHQILCCCVILLLVCWARVIQEDEKVVLDSVQSSFQEPQLLSPGPFGYVSTTPPSRRNNDNNMYIVVSPFGVARIRWWLIQRGWPQTVL